MDKKKKHTVTVQKRQVISDRDRRTNEIGRSIPQYERGKTLQEAAGSRLTGWTEEKFGVCSPRAK